MVLGIDLSLWLYACVTSFAAIFLQGFQLKNIQGNHYLLSFVTSMAMTACNILTVGFVVVAGWHLFIPCAFGGAVGIVASMYFHKRLVK